MYLWVYIAGHLVAAPFGIYNFGYSVGNEQTNNKQLANKYQIAPGTKEKAANAAAF
jgi:hypothetical protein